MSTLELLIWSVSRLKAMLPGVITAGVLTLGILIAMTVFSYGIWIQNKGFTVAGFFFGLNARGRLQVSCAWLKLVFTIVFLVSFQKMEAVNYMMLAIPGLLLVFTMKKTQILISLLWLLLQLAGILSSNTVCGYIREVYSGVTLVLVYIAMALFLTVFAIYMFLTEIEIISERRRVNPRKIWGGEASDEN